VAPFVHRLSVIAGTGHSQRWSMATHKNIQLNLSAPPQAATKTPGETRKACLLVDVSAEAGALHNVSPQGRAELQKLLGELAVAVLGTSAACAGHPPGTEPDISYSHIREAWGSVTTRFQRRQHRGWRVILDSAYSFCLFIAGVGFARLGTTWGAVLMASGAVGAGVSIAALVMLGDQ
jgi:hypothetical protein